MKNGLFEKTERKIKPKKLTKKQEQYWDAMVFLFRLLFLSIPLYAILSLPGLLYPLQLFVTNIVSTILNIMGIPFTQEAAMITTTNPVFAFIIDEDCTGWKSIMFLFALIFATRGQKLNNKIKGLIGGTVIIFTANIVRILSSVLAGRIYGQETAMFLHDIIFRYGLVALVLGIWAFWLFYLNRKIKN